ncbi:MAG: hypothetical protein HUN05_03500 [Desulfobacter sp.]|nr:MAG: hypothetical protein HUN05_03500 [Desulfobacter sp.]
MIQASTSHTPLKKGLSRAEASRWGIPDLEKIKNNPCRNSDRITHLSHRLTKDGITLKFQFSRKCMQGLTYYPAVTLKTEGVSGKTKKITLLKQKNTPQKNLVFFAVYKSLTREIENQKVEIKMPFAQFKKEYFGKNIIPVFHVRTRAQWDASPITNQPEYRFQLPIAKNRE